MKAVLRHQKLRMKSNWLGTSKRSLKANQSRRMRVTMQSRNRKKASIQVSTFPSSSDVETTIQAHLKTLPLMSSFSTQTVKGSSSKFVLIIRNRYQQALQKMCWSAPSSMSRSFLAQILPKLLRKEPRLGQLSLSCQRKPLWRLQRQRKKV